jgi:hypothetical protein
MKIYPNISSRERARRNAMMEAFVRQGARFEYATPDHTLLGRQRHGKGVLCLVDDDPETGKSLGPGGFPTLNVLREHKTHCLIEGGLAPYDIIDQVGRFLRLDYRVMWICTQNTHEIEWAEWAKPHDKWAVMVILTKEEGTA